MVSIRKEMIPEPVEAEDLSTGELITRLTSETTALVKAEVARIKLQAVSLVPQVVVLTMMGIIGLGTFLLGLVAFGIALFAGVQAASGSSVIAGLVAGGIAWLIAAIAAAICAGMARAIPIKLKSLR
jgi:hypothetical protein